MTHEEKTRLIAEFDGWEFIADDEDYPEGCFIREDSFAPFTIIDMGYSSSYSDLMPVWHKFRDLDFSNNIPMLFDHANHKIIIKNELANSDDPKDLFHVLAEAIEWYNTTKVCTPNH